MSLDTPIAVSAAQGSFLALQCKLLGVKNVLEVGTLGGYSALWMTSASEQTRVTTVDVDADATAAATRAGKEAVEKYGYSGGERIEALHGAGLDILPKLVEEVKAGKRERYGFVFIDADKVNNLSYFEMAMEMCTPGACIIVDNVVRRGMLAMTEQQLKEIGADAWSNASVNGAKRVVEAAGKNERVLASTLLQLVGEKNYDGLLMCMIE
ncbi:hypothetical protein K431DRAFT_284217 [Polychaeton citri CBS 116435]|uniref:O-methyltransferase n=1 Tax=Polychaeton citri CBS 116435 TaxID=1314669 RepID=A0A9P4URP7_9PEZI|nr:hypothetical protein K431DRAFT_284217 [Polychaeton citri CBS 116435]